MLFSIIVPVYNRPDEISDLLKSLCQQSDKGFETIIVEDGSSVPCLDVVNKCDITDFTVKYFSKDNEGRSIARNYGMDRADGDFFIFVDSDCILPPDYIKNLRSSLQKHPTHFYGGPDAAHPDFTPTQKAINFAMTSFLTTGGIRGGKISMEKFVPRTFNMGFSREVWQKVGGFREMFSEDIDMSTRIREAGYSPLLFHDVFVYHKRRGNLRKFWHQVHIFGMSRITLKLLYPGSMKAVHWMPAIFTAGSAGLVIASIFQPWALAPLGVYMAALWGSAAAKIKNPVTALRAVAASLVQLYGYGTGFLRAYIWKILLKHGRNEAQEIAMRKGK